MDFFLTLYIYQARSIIGGSFFYESYNGGTMHIAEFSTGCRGGTCPPSIASRFGQTIQTLGHTALDAMKKVYNFAIAYLMKAAFYANIYLHMAWNYTKILASRLADNVRVAASAVLDVLKSSGSKLLEIAQKVVRSVGHFLAAVWVGVKNGAVQGYQATRGFVASHPSQTVIIGAGIALFAASTYAVYRLLREEPQPQFEF
jgi:hypothetical protein